MKLTKALIKEFEKTQVKHGTGVAIFNLYFIISSEILKAAGVTNVKVSGGK